MKLDPKALLKERTELFDNAYNFKHNKRVPLGCNIWSWQVLDCGYKQSQALLNYDIAEKINREFHERYQFDAYTNLITRNPMRLTELLGGGNHFLDPGDEMIQSEGDDIRECREKLPTIALAGGLPTSILGISSAQECLDYARRLVDDMGDGFVLCQNQMISYRNDCKRENLLTYLDYFKTHTY